MSQLLGRADQFLWHWRDCQEHPLALKASWPREEPRDPKVGEGWYHVETDCLYIRDGVEWLCVPED
jgi:hypothetical protein